MAAYAAQRTQFGKQLISFGQIQRLLADSYAAMSAGRCGAPRRHAGGASLWPLAAERHSCPTKRADARAERARGQSATECPADPRAPRKRKAGHCCTRQPRESRSTSRLRREATRACRPTR
jgi:alkylation response protein AidB-like acyl-CoA dehydrogenase